MYWKIICNHLFVWRKFGHWTNLFECLANIDKWHEQNVQFSGNKNVNITSDSSCLHARVQLCLPLTQKYCRVSEKMSYITFCEDGWPNFENIKHRDYNITESEIPFTSWFSKIPRRFFPMQLQIQSVCNARSLCIQFFCWICGKHDVKNCPPRLPTGTCSICLVVDGPHRCKKKM